MVGKQVLDEFFFSKHQIFVESKPVTIYDKYPMHHKLNYMFFNGKNLTFEKWKHKKKKLAWK